MRTSKIQNGHWGLERGVPLGFWALLSTFAKYVFRSKRSFFEKSRLRRKERGKKEKKRMSFLVATNVVAKSYKVKDIHTKSCKVFQSHLESYTKLYKVIQRNAEEYRMIKRHSHKESYRVIPCHTQWVKNQGCIYFNKYWYTTLNYASFWYLLFHWKQPWFAMNLIDLS